MRNFLKPTPVKILTFLSPIIFEIIFWFVVISLHGLNPQDILKVFETVSQTLSFPGLILCAFIPSCTVIRGDVVSTNLYLFYLSSFFAFGIWYLISAAIGEFIAPLYKQFSGLLSSKLRMKSVFVSIAAVLVLLSIFYFISYFANRSFWYKTSGGKNIDVEKWECIDGFLRVQLRNSGFEDISFDEVPIYVGDSLITCTWEGSLTVQSTAICISSEPLGSAPREYLPDWHDIKVKTPTGSTMSSVHCL